jgi:hypothetical protein
VLPLIALLIVGVSAAAVAALAEARHRLRWGLGLTGCVAWAITSAALVWPNGLSFVNELYGGTAGGYRVASESNYDWGHGAPALRRWADRHAGGHLAVWYYGSDPTVGEGPLESVRLHDGDIDANLAGLRGRYLAVSVCLAYGPPLSPPVVEARRRVRGLRPVGRTQTFLIYEVTP